MSNFACAASTTSSDWLNSPLPVLSMTWGTCVISVAWGDHQNGSGFIMPFYSIFIIKLNFLPIKSHYHTKYMLLYFLRDFYIIYNISVIRCAITQLSVFSGRRCSRAGCIPLSLHLISRSPDLVSDNTSLSVLSDPAAVSDPTSSTAPPPVSTKAWKHTRQTAIVYLPGQRGQPGPGRELRAQHVSS